MITARVIADFTVGSSKVAPKLTISALINGRRQVLETVEVIDRRHARRMALAAGAQPWNF